jgi:SAM-dependent methyltransferase
VDPLPFRVELAKRKVTGRLEVHLGKAEDLGFLPRDGFDIVYLNSVIHWIPDIDRALAEITRVLKPGGRLGVSTPSEDTPHDVERAREQALRQCGLLTREDVAAGPPSKLSVDDLRDFLARGGYQLKQLLCRTVVDYESSAAAARVRFYMRYRPVRYELGADPDLTTHRAYGLPQSPMTTEIWNAVEFASNRLARGWGTGDAHGSGTPISRAGGGRPRLSSSWR